MATDYSFISALGRKVENPDLFEATFTLAGVIDGYFLNIGQFDGARSKATSLRPERGMRQSPELLRSRS